MRTKLPKWADFYEMRKYAVTTPNILRKLRRLDRDAAKPYSFCIGPISSFGGDTRVAAYCEDPERWKDCEYISLNSGQKARLSSIEEDCETDESFLIDDAPYKLKRVIENYCKSIEHKSRAPDGSKSTEETKGLLRRRPVRASGIFHRIGKEVDRGTSTDPEYYSDEPLARYGKSCYRFPKALERYSSSELASRTGLSEKTIREARKNKVQPRAKTARRLLWCARVISLPMPAAMLTGANRRTATIRTEATARKGRQPRHRETKASPPVLDSRVKGVPMGLIRREF